MSLQTVMSIMCYIRILAARYPAGKQALDSAQITLYLKGVNQLGLLMPRCFLEFFACGLVAASLAGSGEAQHTPSKPYHHTAAERDRIHTDGTGSKVD